MRFLFPRGAKRPVVLSERARWVCALWLKSGHTHTPPGPSSSSAFTVNAVSPLFSCPTLIFSFFLSADGSMGRTGIVTVYPVIPQGGKKKKEKKERKKGSSASRTQTLRDWERETEWEAKQRQSLDLYTVSKHCGRETKHRHPDSIKLKVSLLFPTDWSNLPTTALRFKPFNPVSHGSCKKGFQALQTRFLPKQQDDVK